MDAKELELILEGKSSKSTSGKIWTIFKCLSIFTWGTGKFIVKNTPTVVGTAWQIKKEISEGISQAIHEVQQEQRKSALDKEIDNCLKNKKSKNFQQESHLDNILRDDSVMDQLLGQSRVHDQLVHMAKGYTASMLENTKIKQDQAKEDLAGIKDFIVTPIKPKAEEIIVTPNKTKEEEVKKDEYMFNI